MNIVTKCPLCAKELFFKLFQAQEYVFLKKQRFQLVCCKACGLVFLNPQPSQQELQEFYPPELFVDKIDSFRVNTPQFMFLRKIKEATRFDKKGILLDVGCGPGYFLPSL